MSEEGPAAAPALGAASAETAAQSRLYPSRPILAASIAVFRDDRVLLMSRAVAPYSDVFTLPGGVVELGESLDEACLRELDEETGVRASLLGFNHHAELIERDEAHRVKRHYVIASFVGLWLAGEGAPSREAKQVLWAAQSDLASLRLTPNLPGVLARARRMVEAAR